MATPSFSDLSTAEGLKALDEYLLSRSYITGFQASRDDLAVFSALSSEPTAYSNATRWYKHIQALLGSNFPGQSVGVVIGGKSSAAAPAAATAVAATAVVAAVAADDDDDDDLDLFGEETEEEKAIREKREADAAATAKPKKKDVGKSSIVLDIKPWDDETDLAKLEASIRALQMEGLTWGASKLVPVGYGIKKLQIMLSIIDDLVSLDELIEEKIQAEGSETAEYVQSVDIVAFNKI